MGQEYSVKCPVCHQKDSVYKDVFQAECFGWEQYDRYKKNPPPFERYLGPDCLKYGEKGNWFMDESMKCYYKINENICEWRFFSCEDCINIGDPKRKEKFTEYNPEGVKIWISQLP